MAEAQPDRFDLLGVKGFTSLCAVMKVTQRTEWLMGCNKEDNTALLMGNLNSIGRLMKELKSVEELTMQTLYREQEILSKGYSTM